MLPQIRFKILSETSKISLDDSVEELGTIEREFHGRGKNALIKDLALTTQKIVERSKLNGADVAIINLHNLNPYEISNHKYHGKAKINFYTRSDENL